MCNASTVTFHLNECMYDLRLDDYHNYTGKIVTPPPQNISVDSSVLLFEYEYAKKAEFDSVLDGNINYFTPRSSNLSDAFHIFVNVNKTGGVYLSVQPPPEFNGTGCMDVPNNSGTLPSVIGIWAWFTDNQTETQCQSDTKPINNCKYSITNNP
eukprot:59138_1